MMRDKKIIIFLFLVFCLLISILATPFNLAAEKKITLTFWHFFPHHPRLIKWWEDMGKEFARMYPEVEMVQPVTIPFEGYEAKYRSTFMGKVGAPDMFTGMLYDWVDFADPMPDYLAENVTKHTFPGIREIAMWKGKMYGLPGIAGVASDFMMLYVNTEMLKEAGLDPAKGPESIDELLDYALKLAKRDPSGKVIRAGFALRYSGHPVGITEKFLPFLHTYGARVISPDGKKASGFLNSPEGIQSLQFCVDLVHKHRVSSLEIGVPEQAFGQGMAAMIFREGWVVGWLRDNAPKIKYKIFPLPTKKVKVGTGALFGYADCVYKESPHKDLAWRYYEHLWNWSLEGTILDRVAPPPRKEDLHCSYMQIRPDYEATIEMLEKRPPSPNHSYYGPKLGQIAYKVGDAILAALFQKKTAKQALDEAAATVDEILSK